MGTAKVLRVGAYALFPLLPLCLAHYMALSCPLTAGVVAQPWGLTQHSKISHKKVFKEEYIFIYLFGSCD